MIRRSLAMLALLPGLIFSGQAAALVITTGGIAAGDNSGVTTAVDGAIIETFDADTGTGGLVQPWSWTTSDAQLHIVQGTQTGQYAAPFGDRTRYLSVAEVVPGEAEVSFGATHDYLGLYWGSVDTYNTLQLLLNGDLVATITGNMAMDPANGDQGEAGSAYINIFDVVFDSARFQSTQPAFEIDNLAVASLDTPAEISEPATLALFGIGLIGLGFAARRRLRRVESGLEA